MAVRLHKYYFVGMGLSHVPMWGVSVYGIYLTITYVSFFGMPSESWLSPSWELRRIK